MLCKNRKTTPFKHYKMLKLTPQTYFKIIKNHEHVFFLHPNKWPSATFKKSTSTKNTLKTLKTRKQNVTNPYNAHFVSP